MTPEQAQQIEVVKMLFGNPFFVAALASHFLELTEYFQDVNKPATAKMGIVLAVCAVIGALYQALTPAGLDVSKAGILSLTALVTALWLSTQIVHLLAAKLSPTISALLFPPKPIVTVTTTDNAGTSTTQAVVVNAPELADAKG